MIGPKVDPKWEAQWVRDEKLVKELRSRLKLMKMARWVPWLISLVFIALVASGSYAGISTRHQAKTFTVPSGSIVFIDPQTPETDRKWRQFYSDPQKNNRAYCEGNLGCRWVPSPNGGMCICG